MTTRRFSGGIVLGLALALASGSARAATITTPAIGAFGTNRLVCTVTNVSTKDVDVMLQIVNGSGTTLVNLPLSIEPGEAEGGGTGQGPTQGFCRVTGAPKAKVRVALCTTDSVLNCLAAVAGE